MTIKKKKKAIINNNSNDNYNRIKMLLLGGTFSFR